MRVLISLVPEQAPQRLRRGIQTSVTPDLVDVHVFQQVAPGRVLKRERPVLDLRISGKQHLAITCLKQQNHAGVVQYTVKIADQFQRLF